MRMMVSNVCLFFPQDHLFHMPEVIQTGQNCYILTLQPFLSKAEMVFQLVRVEDAFLGF